MKHKANISVIIYFTQTNGTIQMAKNTKKTSNKVASQASKILSSKNSSQTAKKLAASALSQTGNKKQTGSKLEDLASTVLSSSK